MSRSAGVLKEALEQNAALKAEKRAHDRETAIRSWPEVSIKDLAARLNRDESIVSGWVKRGKP